MEESATVQFKLNIPVTLKDRLAAAAERSGRSLTAEINTRLQASLSLADDNGLEFTHASFEAFILELVERGTEGLRNKVRDLDYIVTGRDPYNRDA